MRSPLLGLLLLALALPSVVARAQVGLPDGSPDGLLTWERVGDRPIDASTLVFDGSGALYAVHIIYVYRLDLSGGFPGVWEFRSDETSADAMIGLGPDTLVTAASNTERSTDGGLTWVEVYDDGSSSPFGLYEASSSNTLAGTLFVGSHPVAISEDRGQSWEDRSDLPDGEARAFTALASGRLVTGGWWGAAYSDNAGTTWHTSSLWEFGRYSGDGITGTDVVSGSKRVLLTGVDAMLPHVRAWYSDDEGETWRPKEGVPLPEPIGGVGGGRTSGLWALDSSRALAVLGRGSVYLTEDGGETWAVVGQVPDVNEDIYANTSVLGPDGRLYVGLVGLGTLDTWVYRTQQQVATPVAVEPVPEPPEALRLTVRPNPSAGAAVAAVLHLSRPAEVEAVVYDVLGRRVALVHSGALGAGAHTLALDASGLPSGVYAVHVTARDAGGAARVVVRRFTVAR